MHEDGVKSDGTRRSYRIASLPCGRRSKYLVLVFWLVVVAVTGGLAGKLQGAEKNDASAYLPASAESTQELNLQARFVSKNLNPAVVVYLRHSGITQADVRKAAADARAFGALPAVHGRVTGPIVSRDHRAIETVVGPVGAGLQAHLRLRRGGHLDAAVRVRLPGRLGIDYNIFLMTRAGGIQAVGYSSGRPDRAGRDRRRDHVGGRRAGRDVRDARHPAAGDPDRDRIHRGDRRAARHDHRQVRARHRADSEHRAVDVVAEPLAAAPPPTERGSKTPVSASALR
jgi:hypothetical protein